METLADPDFGQAHQVLTQAIESNTITVSGMGVPTRLPWLTDEILREISHRDWLSRNRRIPGLSQEAYTTRFNLYEKQRNRVTALMRNARKRFVEHMIQKAIGCQGKLWQVVRYVLRNQLSETN